MDDAFITYTFARNLSLGHGISFYAGGPPVYGSTTFTYTLVLALAGYLGFDIPTTSVVLGALFWALSYALVYVMFRDRVGVVPALLILVLGASSTIRVVTHSVGMETGLYTFLVLSSFALYRRNRLCSALIVSALLVMTRLDGALVPALIFGHYVLAGTPSFVEKVRKLARAAWPMLLMLSGWLLFLQLYFGTVLPNSFLAKRLYGDEIGTPFQPLFYLNLLSPGRIILVSHSQHGWWLVYNASLFLTVLFVLIAGVGVVRAGYEWRNPGALPLFWIPFYILMFYLSGMRSSHWYYAPLFPVLYASFVFGAYWLVQNASLSVHSRRIIFLASTISVMLLVYAAMLVGGIRDTYDQISHDPFGKKAFQTDRHHILAKVIRKDMRHRGLEQTDVMAFEVGYLGYYVPGRVYDILGLVSPDVVKKGGFRRDPLYILEHYKPQYAAITVTKRNRNPATGPIARSETFRHNYKVIYSRPRHGSPGPYKILRRIDNDSKNGKSG